MQPVQRSSHSLDRSHRLSNNPNENLYQSRNRHEETKSETATYLKIILSAIVLILLVLIFRFFFGGSHNAPSIDVAQPVQTHDNKSCLTKIYEYIFGTSTKRSNNDSIKYVDLTSSSAQQKATADAGKSTLKDSEYLKVTEPEKKEGGFWSRVLPSWGCDEKWRSMKEKLKNMKNSVKPFLFELPSAEAIRSNPGKFNLNLADLAALPVSQLKSQADPSMISESIRSMSNLQTEDPAKGLAQDIEKMKALEKQLDDDSQLNLRLKLNDLVASNKALAVKKAKLAEFANNLKASVAAMNECEGEENRLAQSLNDSKSEEDQLSADIVKAEQEEAQLNQKLAEKKSSLSDAGKSVRDKIQELEQKLAGIRSVTTRKPDILREIDEMNRKIKMLEKSITDDSNDMDAYLRQIRELETKAETSDEEIRAKTKKLEDRRKLVELISLELSLLLSHQATKEELMKYIPEKEKAQMITGTFTGSIEETKKFLETIEENGADEPIRNTIQQEIERDKKGFSEIMSKFYALQKAVNDFNNNELKIKTLKEKLSKFEDELSAIRNEVRLTSEQLVQYRAEIERLRLLLPDFERRRVSYTEEIRSLQEQIARKMSELNNAESMLSSYTNELEAARNEAKLLNEQLAAKFGDLDAQRKIILDKLFNLKSKRNELQPKIRALEKELAKAKGDCGSQKLFYVRLNEALPGVKAQLQADEQAIAQIKGDLQKQFGYFLEN